MKVEMGNLLIYIKSRIHTPDDSAVIQYLISSVFLCFFYMRHMAPIMHQFKNSSKRGVRKVSNLDQNSTDPPNPFVNNDNSLTCSSSLMRSTFLLIYYDISQWYEIVDLRLLNQVLLYLNYWF